VAPAAGNQRLSLELRTAEPVLKRHVDSKQEKAKRFGLSRIRAPGSPLNAVCDWCSASHRSTCR
jgi:two-component system response regulator HupR/HoxA